MTKGIDKELVGKFALEISQRYKRIMKLFPNGNDEILKHLAASSIHMAFFMRDFHDITKGEKTSIDKELEDEFLNKCGCDLKDKK